MQMRPTVPWNGRFEKYAENFARKNAHKLQWIDQEDLVQEFHIKFWKMQQKGLTKDRLHGGDEGYSKALFAAFKSGCNSVLVDLIRKWSIVRNHPERVRPKEVPVSSDEELKMVWGSSRSNTHWLDAELMEALDGAPEPVRLYIQKCVFADHEPEEVCDLSVETVFKMVKAWAKGRKTLLNSSVLS